MLETFSFQMPQISKHKNHIRKQNVTFTWFFFFPHKSDLLEFFFRMHLLDSNYHDTASDWLLGEMTTDVVPWIFSPSYLLQNLGHFGKNRSQCVFD